MGERLAIFFPKEEFSSMFWVQGDVLLQVEPPVGVVSCEFHENRCRQQDAGRVQCTYCFCYR